VISPAKFVHDSPGRIGSAKSSVIGSGSIISGAQINHCLLSTGVRIHSYAEITDSIVLPDVDIARSAKVSRAIIDRGVRIPEGLTVGEDLEADSQRFRMSPNGVRLITQEMIDRLGR
jgi:glucose-1-phosphate adenylyltransferase